MIRGIVVRENGAAIEEFDESFTPDGDVLVDVAWSDLNFKDGLAVTGRPGVVRTTPLVAGIDLVGTVVESTSPRWAVGDTMILIGAGLSETKHGGYATQASVDGNTVEMDHERSQFSENAIRYEAGLTFITGRIKTMLSAIQWQ